MLPTGGPGRVSVSAVCAAQNVVHADTVKIRQSAQHLGRNHPLPALIVGIGSLGQVDGLTHLCLGKIPVLPQVAYSWIALHLNHRNQYSLEQIVLL